MNAAIDPPAAPHRRRLRRRKIKAVLAAGIVFGIGAAATLAAYTDDEYASGTFTAGRFGIEGSTSAAAVIPDSSWTSHPSASPAALSFTTGGVFNNLLPGNTVYAPFSIRIDATTTTNGSLTLPGATTTGTPANFTYGIKVVADPTLCNQTGYLAALPVAVVVADGTALSTAAPAGGYATTLLKTQGVAVPVTYCFAVTAGALVAQGQTATATWHFLGTAVPLV